MVIAENGSLIGVDLGGTKVAAGRIDGIQLSKIVHRLIPAQSKYANDIIDVLKEVISELINEDVLGIGIGIPGLVDRELGIVYDIQNIPSWKEVPLREILEDYFHLPVYIDNDANCFALGESRFGKGIGEDDFVGITLGTGMGSGIIKNGFLIEDAHCGSGEFGNIPYLDSIYEDYCSGKFFVKKYNFSGEELAEAAGSNDIAGVKAYKEFGRHLGNAIKTIKLAVDPKLVIIGGSVAKSSKHFKDSMWKEILDFPFPRAISDFEVIFSNTDNIAVIGAASLYLNRTHQKNLTEKIFSR